MNIIPIVNGFVTKFLETPMFKTNLDHYAYISISPINAIGGCIQKLNINNEELIDLVIPPGIKHRQLMRLTGKGDFQPGTGRRGDLYLTILIVGEARTSKASVDCHSSSTSLRPPNKYTEDSKSGNNPPESTLDRVTKNTLHSPKGERLSTSIEEVLEKLHNLIGLASVKRDVQETIDIIKYQRMLQQQGNPPIAMSRHMVFTGNPGTGKTTIARILGEIYKHLGVLSKGHMVETDRAGLVAGYLGQTAIKTEEVVSSALGGILFIDEAYALTSEDKDQFGQEAIDTLLKRMEDYRDDFIVIVAGYPEEMSRFVNANPGLQSRFTKYIHFDDYASDELYQIYKLLLGSGGHYFAPTNDDYFKNIFLEIDRLRDGKFGNGRTVRNLYEKTIGNVATRVVRTMPRDIREIVPDDITTKDLYSVLQIKDAK